MSDPIPDLRPDEIAHLGTARCKCGHLEALHNTHCCPFCMVAGCPCELGWDF